MNLGLPEMLKEDDVAKEFDHYWKSNIYISLISELALPQVLSLESLRWSSTPPLMLDISSCWRMITRLYRWTTIYSIGEVCNLFWKGTFLPGYVLPYDLCGKGCLCIFLVRRQSQWDLHFSGKGVIHMKVWSLLELSSPHDLGGSQALKGGGNINSSVRKIA